MFHNQQQATAAQQVQIVTQQLTQALLRKEELAAQLEEASKAVIAYRNVIQGIQLGQQLAAEVAAEAQSAPAPAEIPPTE